MFCCNNQRRRGQVAFAEERGLGERVLGALDRGRERVGESGGHLDGHGDRPLRGERLLGGVCLFCGGRTRGGAPFERAHERDEALGVVYRLAQLRRGADGHRASGARRRADDARHRGARRLRERVFLRRVGFVH